MTLLLLLAMLITSLSAMADESGRLFRKFSAADGLADNSAHTIHCTKTGRMVITTMGQINFYDGQKFTYIDAYNENLYPLSDYQGNYHLYFDNYHHIWLKNTNNVTCVDLMTERFVDSVEDEFKQFGINEKVRDLFVDHEGMVWLLTKDGVLNVEDKKPFSVRKGLNLQDLDVYDNKYLLLFYSNGVVAVLDLATGKKIHERQAYQTADISKYNKSSVLLMEDSLCYQIRNGEKEAVLLQYDILKNDWKELLRTPYHLNNIAKHDSLLFVPCEYGFWTYDMILDKTVYYETVKLENGYQLATCLNVMAFDRQGGLWIGTERAGLLYSRPYQAPFKQYGWDDKRSVELARHLEDLSTSAQFKGKWVNCVYKDSRGWIWVGTNTGLQYYRGNSDHLPKMVTKRDGLLNNVIHSIVEDRSHNIWVSTSYGISCIQLDGNKVHFVNSYNNYDNVPNESFINGKAKCMPDGMIIMQSQDHIITFNPDNMTTLKDGFPFDLYPKLIRMQVNGNEIRTGDELDGKVILDRALTRTYEINLDYQQNSLSLVFSALNYFRPYQTFYRVRISGLRDDWHVYTPSNSGGLVDSRGLLHLPLISLHPGSYVIEVQASMNPYKWDTTPYEWIVTIHEPWWRTTGMFVAFGAILLIMLGVNIYYYLRNANLRAMRNSEEVTMLKRISRFAERCTNGRRKSDLLEPVPEEVHGEFIDPSNDLSEEFMDMMVKIIPDILSKKTSQLTMRQLSEKAGYEVEQFYTLISSNIYKNPRSLAIRLMLKRAEHELRNTIKPINLIAEECGFVSPNYFIATFFHYYHFLPSKFRETK